MVWERSGIANSNARARTSCGDLSLAGIWSKAHCWSGNSQCACFFQSFSIFAVHWEMSTRVMQESSWVATSVIINVYIKSCANCTLLHDLFPLAAPQMPRLYSQNRDESVFGSFFVLVDGNGPCLVRAAVNITKQNEISIQNPFISSVPLLRWRSPQIS